MMMNIAQKIVPFLFNEEKCDGWFLAFFRATVRMRAKQNSKVLPGPTSQTKQGSSGDAYLELCTITVRRQPGVKLSW